MKKLLTVTALLLPLLVGAQTLDECQQAARQNYPLIRKYGLIEQTTGRSVSNAQKGWLPQVSATAQATLQSDVTAWPDQMKTMLQQFGVSIPGMKKDQYRVGVDVSQTLYDGGAISSQKRIALRQGEVEAAQNDVGLYQVAERVNQLYFGILLTDERLRLNDDLLTLLESNLQKLETMHQRGVATRSNVSVVKAELLNARQTATELQATRTALCHVLATLCGMDSIVSVVRPASLLLPGSDQQNQRPELRAIDAQLRLADAQEQALRSRLLPRLSVFAQGFYGYPGYNMFESMMNRDWSLNGMVGARLTWSIDGLYRHKNDRARIQLQRQTAENQREVFLFNNRLQQTEQHENMAKYRQLLREDDELVALRSEVRQSAESKLSHGIIDTNNLLQEITRENQARIGRSTHELQLLQEQYNLKYTTNN